MRSFPETDIDPIILYFVFSGTLTAHPWDYWMSLDLRNLKFEQLCINTANEQLAYFYNQRAFVWEQVKNDPVL